MALLHHNFTLNQIEHTGTAGQSEEIPDLLPQSNFSISRAAPPLLGGKPSKKRRLPVKATPIAEDRLLIAKATECVSISDITIDMFGKIDLSEDAMQAFRKTAVYAQIRTDKGGIAPIAVNVVGNCIAMEGKGQSLSWLSSVFTFVRKVKAKNGEVYADIRIADDLDETIVRVPVSAFHTDSIKKLSQYGILYAPGAELPLSTYCQQEITKLPTEAAEQNLGLIYQKNQFKFLGYDTGILTTKNSYDGIEAYTKALNDLIADSIPIQYVLAVSMGATVMTALKWDYNLDLHSYCVNLVGLSSTGKTITSKLAASMWGNPNDKKMFTAMMATNNAMYKMLDGRMGVPIFLDECSVSGNVKTDEFGYQIYEEREKHRLNADCTERVSGTWSTIPIMTGEEHFHNSRRSQNGGLAVRIHNADNLVYTTSREHADAISQFFSENYGVLGKIYVKQIIADIDNLKNQYEIARKQMRDRTAVNKNKYTERLVNSYALTYTAAELLQELGITIDIDGIAKIMTEQNKAISSECNIAENAIAAIESYAASHGESSEIIRYGCDGKKPVTSVAITENLVQKIFADAGFQDIKVTIHEIDEAGRLIRQGKGERNGRKSRLSFDGICTTCYQFRLIDLLPLSKPEKRIDKNDFFHYSE